MLQSAVKLLNGADVSAATVEIHENLYCVLKYKEGLQFRKMSVFIENILKRVTLTI